MLTRDLMQPLQETIVRLYQPHIANGGLENDTGNLARVLFEGLPHRMQIIKRQRQGMFGQVGRHARTVRHPKSHRARSGFDQQTIAMTMVTAGKFNNPVAARIPSRQTNGAHGGFRAGVDHAHHFHGRECIHNALRQLHFQFGGRAKAAPRCRRFLHRHYDLRVRVAKNHRPPRSDVVDIGVAIDVIDPRALRTLDKRRLHTD